MILLKLLASRLWTITLGSVIALAPVYVPATVLAQTNQSDVTGPNLSDITGPNLFDILDAVNGEIFETATGDLVNLADFFQDFFDTYGEELGLDPDASLADNLMRVNRACSAESTGTRRFARTPGPSIQPVSLACTEFSRLVKSAKQSLERYRLLQTADRRVW
ncbi:MAG: hypothetical protein F6K31_41890 [Symploca sp. SIO2G7]|nr:hypothetical protein [Symploca sp. SIO2G7]